ncbi:MAG: hypothetical protein HW421_3294 [Ignavibacteria bacterium]|nr:hypothetical protein [Ignavibacteria bacterium]
MKTLIFVILSILGFISLFNTVCDSKNKKLSKKEIIPIAEGNNWTYDNYYYRSPRKDSICEAGTIQLVFGKKIIIKNEEWVQWGVFGFGFSNVGINKKEGFYRIFYDSIQDINFDSAFLFFKYPTEPGDKWYSKFENDTIQTISLYEEVTVPAGTFKCIHYRTKGLSKYPNNGFFIAPGVGMIKCEIIGGIDISYPIPDTVWNILKLTKYKVK